MYNFSDGDIVLSRKIHKYSISIYDIKKYNFFEIQKLLIQIKSFNFSLSTNNKFVIKILGIIMLTIKKYFNIDNYIKFLNLYLFYTSNIKNIKLNIFIELFLKIFKYSL